MRFLLLSFLTSCLTSLASANMAMQTPLTGKVVDNVVVPAANSLTQVLGETDGSSGKREDAKVAVGVSSDSKILWTWI